MKAKHEHTFKRSTEKLLVHKYDHNRKKMGASTATDTLEQWECTGMIGNEKCSKVISTDLKRTK